MKNYKVWFTVDGFPMKRYISAESQKEAMREVLKLIKFTRIKETSKE